MKIITLDIMYRKLVRCWLIGVLLFIPFMTRLYQTISPWNGKLASFINRLDELTILIFLPLALIEFYKKYKKGELIVNIYLILIFPIFIICISGIISGMLNGNSILITTLGTFAYVKYFLVIFIYAAFFKDYMQFKRVFRLLLIIAVGIGLLAFVEESWAMYSNYLSKENIESSGLRLGIYRATSLLSHYNLLGLYSLFILTFYLYLEKKINTIIVLSLIAGIVTSVSRVAYTGFVILAGLQIFKKRRMWLLIFMIPIIGVLFVMGLFGDDVDISAIMNNDSDSIENNTMLSYREFSRHKAMDVWKDHPVWGAGPGMFGGSVAYKNRSPLYEEYNFTLILNWFHSLDQLWPQVLAEMGLVGAAALASLFISLLFVIFISRQQETNVERKNQFDAMLTFTFIFLIYTLSGNLNNVSILYPYCAFVGMGLGSLGPPSLQGAIEIR